MMKLAKFFELSRVRRYLSLVRPLNLLIGALAGGVGVWLVTPNPPLRVLILVGLSVVGITAFGNGVNDLMDVKTDRVSHPGRPLPMGLVGRGEAWGVSGFALSCGLLAAGLLGDRALLFASGVALLLFFYSYQLKRVVLLGNLLVALASSLVFPYGAVAIGSGIERAIYPAIFVFLFHLGREFLKDVMDMVGDRSSNYRTLALHWGRRPTLRLAAIILWGLIPLTLIPWLTHDYSTYYLGAVLAVDLSLFWAAKQIWSAPSGLEPYSRLLKFAMLLGLVALALGPL